MISSPNDGTPRPSNGYSATVRIALHVNGSRLPVAKVSQNRLYLRDAHKLRASSGEVVMDIDGHERRWRVALQPSEEPSQIIEATFETS